MSDEAPVDFRVVADFFGLPGTATVAKDIQVVRAVAALAAIDAAPFRLVFGGGTALARAHRLIRRMSEDVDFKIVPLPAAPISRSALRQQLGALRDRVTTALWAAGFEFDPHDRAALRSRNENRYTVYHLPYSESGVEEGLRATIQIELTYAALRLPPVTLPVSSFVSEAYGCSPEVSAMRCVSVTETAAEKLISLTRRTAMDLAGLSRDADPALLRHIYDLHQLRNLVDADEVADLAGTIAEADAEEFENQYPAYAANIPGETRKALHALQTDPLHRNRYDDFVSAMVYGERVEFAVALGGVAEMVNRFVGKQ